MLEELNRIYNYLLDYENLCIKNRLKIYACGCCDSPYLVQENDKDDIYIDNINFDFERNILEFDLHIYKIDKRTKLYEKYYNVLNDGEDATLDKLKKFIDILEKENNNE